MALSNEAEMLMIIAVLAQYEASRSTITYNYRNQDV